MRSPFAIFRKNQRVLMVVTIGLALFAFVICGGVGSASDIPKSLVALAIVCMCGGVAWVIGVPGKKSSETGTMGLIIGVALAVLMIRTSGPPVAVRAETGNVTRDEFDDLRRRRELANLFVQRAIFDTRDETEAQSLIPDYMFGGLDGNPNGERDIMTTELLRREAETMGLAIPESAVSDYIKEMTDNRMTPQLFKKLRLDLGLGEDELYSILADELQARLAAEFLFDFDFNHASRLSPTMTPEQYWQFYRKIWVQQSAEVAVIPVADFVDESAEPPTEDLLRLFQEHRGNYPNLTKSGELEEGRFGFMQPRKVEVAFLEVLFDDVRSTVEDATDAEIDAYYQEHYVLPAEARAADAAAAAAEAEMEPDDGPLLPELQRDPESTDPESNPETPDAPASADPDSPAPNADETPGAETPPASTPQPESSELPPDGTSPDSDAPQTGSARLPGLPGETQFVALQQVPPPDAAPEQPSAPAGDEPVADPSQPAAADDPASTADDPADPAATAPETDPAADQGAAGETTDPMPPDTAAPPLTEALREQIRTEIVRERTREKMQKTASEAVQELSDLAYRTSLPEDDDQYLTTEQVSAEVARYAEEHDLYYATTPKLTFNDLQESEEYPVGSAFVEGRGTVAQTLSQSNPEDLNRADVAEGLETDSLFVFWKVADHEAEEPASLDDEGVRDQVVEAWRLDQARTTARNRAEELLVLVEGAGNDMIAALGGQTTTGEEDGDALVVIPTGEFRWLSDPRAPRPDPFFSSPQLRDPSGVTAAGPDFMDVVFNQLAPGEVGIAANMDLSELYLVKVLERTPWGDEEEDVFRREFLAQPVFEEFSGFGGGFTFSSVYQRLATAEALRQRSTWVEQLWEKHGAQLLEAG